MVTEIKEVQASTPVLEGGIVYICKYKKSAYSCLFEIRLFQYSPNGKAMQYGRTLGDLYNDNATVAAWVETDHFWQQYELVDQFEEPEVEFARY